MSVGWFEPESPEDELDHVAIEWAIGGTPMKLSRAEQKEAVRRMTGRREPEDIARLVGCTSRQVFRLRDEL